MAGIIAATVVSGIGSALISSSASSSAANKQVQASKDAQAAQDKMFQQQVALQEPFRQGGMAAQNRLMTLLGLNPNAGNATTATSGGAPQTYTTPFGNVTVPANAMGGQPATNANGIVVDPNSPDFGKYARDFGMSDFTADPGYQFRQDQGMQALERSAAARGGLLSGSALKGIERFSQGLASQEYGNAYDRYQTNRNNQLNPLYNLMNIGIGAATNQGGAASAQGQNQANALNAQGYYAGTAAAQSGNAWGNAFNNIGTSVGNALARSSSYGSGGKAGVTAPIFASNSYAAPTLDTSQLSSLPTYSLSS